MKKEIISIETLNEISDYKRALKEIKELLEKRLVIGASEIAQILRIIKNVLEDWKGKEYEKKRSNN